MATGSQDATSSPAGKRAKSLTKRLLWVLSFIAAFAASRVAMQWYFDDQRLKAASASGSRMVEALREKAVSQHPNQPVPYAMAEEATKASGERLSSSSGESKAQEAAGQFLRFYLVNVRARREYCQRLGIDITPFVEAFSAEHRDLYKKSRRIIARGPYPPDQVEDRLYNMMLPTLQTTVGDAMQTMGSEVHASKQQVCAAFSANGAKIASAFQLATLNPALYQVLLEVK
ncbi:hypothetical protein [Ralstonia sp. 24A2]|uniref:hypothetical protein n=1 Tax=Ralstonia sp. 24A2 TaxID=3447364 RepID=UPI003F6A47C0